MGICEDRITEDSTEFEKAFLKIYDGNLWTALDKIKYWQPPKPLVVVPQIVADFIKTLKIKGVKPLMDSVTFGEIGFTEEKRDEILHWINEHQEEYMRAWVDDYTVEKERLYVLKHIDLSEQHKNESVYLSHSRHAKLKHESFSKDADMSKFKQCHFIQSEIDKLNIGSYVKIEVEP